MGNQNVHHTNPPSYYSVEYLNGSAGIESVPDILNQDQDYTHSITDSVNDQLDYLSQFEQKSEKLSTIRHLTPPPSIPLVRNNVCTIQRSKSYVRPENKVLPRELPTKPLRKTNYLKTDGFKRTWRHKKLNNNNNNNNNSANNSQNLNYSNLSMPDNLNKIHLDKEYGNYSDASSSSDDDDWQSPSLIEALQNKKNIIQNEIKNFRDKYSRSMGNLEEWTNDDRLDNMNQINNNLSNLTKATITHNNNNHQNNNFHKKIFKLNDKNNEATKVVIKPQAPIIPSINQTFLNDDKKRLQFSRSINLTSTPTNLDRVYDLNFSLNDNKSVDTNLSNIKITNGIRKQYKEKLGNENPIKKEVVKKTVDFRFDVNDQIRPKDFNKQQQQQQQKKNVALKLKDQTNGKLDTIGKAKAIIMQSKRQQLMEQSINESLDINEHSFKSDSCKKPGKKLKSKSFLYNDSYNKNDSIKNKFGIRTLRGQRKNNERFKTIDLDRDIQIISRFPINSKVYRHYIGGGNVCDKLTSSYNVVKMMNPEDRKYNAMLSSSSNHGGSVRERAIDVDEDIEARKNQLKSSSDIKIKKDSNFNDVDKKAVLESLNKVFDPIYDSIEEYQLNKKNNKNCQQITKQIVNVVNASNQKYNDAQFNSYAYGNDNNILNQNNAVNKPQMEPYSNLIKSTTTFKPIAKVNPTSSFAQCDRSNLNSNNNNNINNNNNNKEFENNQNKPGVLDINEKIHLFNKYSNNNVSNEMAKKAENIHYNCQIKKPIISDNNNNNAKFGDYEHNNQPTNEVCRSYYVNRKCSMNSEKLEPILETTTTTPTINTTGNNENSKIRRKTTIEISKQRLNEKLQDEIQKAYEERTRRFNQVKMAIRSNSILSNDSYNQIFRTKSPAQSQTSNQELRIRTTNIGNKTSNRQIVNEYNSYNQSPLPSPPILNPHKLQYSVSSCSSVTLPPPPPPQFSYNDVINQENNFIKYNKQNFNSNICQSFNDINEQITSNKVNLKTFGNNNRNPNSHSQQQQQQQQQNQQQQQQQQQQNSQKLHIISKSSNNLALSSTSTSSTSSSSTSSTSTSASTSSISSPISTTINYFSTADKSTHRAFQPPSNDFILNENKKIENIFDACTNELLGMDDSIMVGNNNNKKNCDTEDNFILKSKPSTNDFRANSNNDTYPKLDITYETDKLDNSCITTHVKDDEPKTLAKNRRRGLDEIFPEIKTAIHDAQRYVHFLKDDESNDEEIKNNNTINNFNKLNNDTNKDVKDLENSIKKFHIDDLNWCPASDLGDFDFDDYDLKSKDENQERPRKKTKHSNSFLSNNNLKQNNAESNLVARPIPIHIKSGCARAFQAEQRIQSPIFTSIQTKLSSFESMNKNDRNNNINNTNSNSNRVNRVISNAFNDNVDISNNNNKWTTVELHDSNNIKITSNISENGDLSYFSVPTKKAKFEINVKPMDNNIKNNQFNDETFMNISKNQNQNNNIYDSDENAYETINYGDDMNKKDLQINENKFQDHSHNLKKWMRRNSGTIDNQNNIQLDSPKYRSYFKQTFRNAVQHQQIMNMSSYNNSNVYIEPKLNDECNNDALRDEYINNAILNGIQSQTTNQQSITQNSKDRYRTLIKVKKLHDPTSSDDEAFMNAKIRKQNLKTFLERATLEKGSKKENLVSQVSFKSGEPAKNINHNNGSLLRSEKLIELNNRKTNVTVNDHNSMSSGNNKLKLKKYGYIRGHLKVETSNIGDDLDYSKECSDALDAILYDTDRKSSVGAGSGPDKLNPIYYSSSNESIYGNLL